MSKIGKKPIEIPSWVEVSLNNGLVRVKWPKWELSYNLLKEVEVEHNDNMLTVKIDNDDNKKFWGLTRTLLSNMIKWVTEWYEKKLIIIWVWYGAKIQGSDLVLSLWLSHKINFLVPKGITTSVEQNTKWNSIVSIVGIDKQLVWEVTAKIRALKKPEPYKGKWIRYIEEEIKLKPGKAAA